MFVDVLTSRVELSGRTLGGVSAIAVDALRCTTSMLAALEANARRIHAVASVEEALELRRLLREAEVRLCGEREGRRIEGFDLGNSPLEFVRDTVGGKTLVFTTTNGTRMLSACEGADELYLACFRNRAAVVDRLVAEHDSSPRSPRGIVIACAGREARLSLDDLLCAGLIVEGLTEAVADVRLSDAARAALATARETGAPSFDFLASTAAGESLLSIGLGSDLEYCARLDVSRAVPCFEDGGYALSRVAAAPGAGER